MTTRLTYRRLLAIAEALQFRLAGEIEEEGDGLAVEDYAAAKQWANEQLDKRERGQ